MILVAVASDPTTTAAVESCSQKVTTLTYQPGKEWLGYMYQMLFVAQLCFNQFLGKVLFIRHPDLNPAELITIRNFFASLIVLGMMNKDFKTYMIDNVPRSQYRSLAIRCFQGSFQFVCMYTCIKYFPVVIVTLVSNIGPLLIALLSYILFKIGLSRFDLAILLISFLGCLVLITGTISGNSHEGEDTSLSSVSSSEMIVPTILLMIIPINNACINLYLRQMRDMNEITLGSYIIFTMFVIYAPITTFAYGFGFLYDFELTDWVVCVLLGFTSAFL